ncbi:MAG: polysaccharide biosynthesis C-terminal domain-containing protein, partial [Lachnospiraceae bacterium]
IPIALASAMSAAVIPTIASTFEMQAYGETNRKIAQAIKVTMLISIPSAVGLFVLAKPVVMLLYPQRATVDMVASLIRVLSVTVVFYGLSTLTNAVLQGIGKVNLPVVHAAVSWLLQSAVLLVLLFFTDFNLYSLCIATVVYSFLMCLLNGISVRKHLGYHQEMMRTFLLPVVSSFWMGLAAFGVYWALAYLIRLIYKEPQMEIAGINNVLCLVPAIAIAAIFYFVMILKMGVVTKKELKKMPKGTTLLRIAVKFHILK